MGLAVLWVVLAPLLLIPITWGLHKLVTKPFVLPLLAAHVKQANRTLVGTMISVGFVLSILALSYFPGRVQFEQLCEKHEKPQVSQRVVVDGFFNADLAPYEAVDFLNKKGFSYVEGRDIYAPAGYVRHAKDENGKIREQKIARPTSLYAVKRTVTELPLTIVVDEKVIYEISSNKELARAASVTYHGGPLRWLLGYDTLSTCPDPRTTEGSKNFLTSYNLEEYVLRSSEVKSR